MDEAKERASEPSRRASFNPARLTLARESRGMTQTALAKACRISQSTISKTESGVLAPSDDMVDAWAAALSYPRNFFFRWAEDRGLPATVFRKRRSLGTKATRQITARVNVVRHQVGALARSVELPEIKINAVDLDEKLGLTAPAVAQELRQAWGVPRGPIPNLSRLLEDNGIVVVPFDFGTRKIDGISIYEHNGVHPPMMFINKLSPFDRVRFTMAHELGHLMMHMHMVVPPASCEAEADSFAAEFLMPRADIRGQLNRISMERLMHLKSQWRVAMSALLKRAADLRAISDRTARRHWMRMSSLGWRTKEPVTIPPENPELLPEMIRVHREELGYSVHDLAAALDMQEAELVREYAVTQPRLRLVRGPRRDA